MANGVLRTGRVALALRLVAVWGPGLLVMLADTDAGNVVTAAQAGAQWGYRLLPLWLLLIPPLYMVQQLTVRLGVFTGRGYAELIREHFGPWWAWISVAGLAIATVSSLVTEFTAVAGIGELYGLSRTLTLPFSCAMLLLVATMGAYRRVERTAIVVGLFELAFFVVAWSSHPDHATVLRDLSHMPFGDRTFLYLTAAVIGATFNPWMVFYQQSGIVEKKLGPADYRSACWDTAFGAVLTQALCAAVLIAVAATFGSAGKPVLENIGEVSLALQPALGPSIGRFVFGLGVLGAAMVAAIVASLALAWGVGEVAGFRHSLGERPAKAGWFHGAYVAGTLGSAALVWRVADLVWLNIAAQVVNVFLLPLVLGFLVALASKALPAERRLRGWYRVVLIGVCCGVCAVGWIGGLSQL
ncbi:NRAMP family metal ion transporter [Trinickia symbiotica]|uniref:NRAMP family metal ion transporter n=1 Tax=Trinickia symbiotica TaxID=863227 RepID=A0A2T3XTZ1_9BURK|nr:divalent metal cation transporter [Trinickia symbiotica]PTB19965.1 NRAMP family metal ion transporter [Trinickia symbiotica]